MKSIKTIVKILLGLIIMISLSGAICLWEISNTILNKEYMLKKMEEQNYYENIHTNILNEMKGYIGPSGLDEEVLKDIVTVDKIKKDTQIILTNVYENKDETIETQEIKNNLDANIENYLQENHLKVDDKGGIEEFKEKMLEEYERGISYNLYTKYSQKIPFHKIQTQIRKLKAIGTIIVIFSVLIYVLMDMKKGYEVMCFILASGMIISGSSLFIEAKLGIEHIRLLNDAVSIMIREMANEIFNNMKLIGGIVIVLSIGVLVLGNIKKREKTKN